VALCRTRGTDLGAAAMVHDGWALAFVRYAADYVADECKAHAAWAVAGRIHGIMGVAANGSQAGEWRAVMAVVELNRHRTLNEVRSRIVSRLVTEAGFERAAVLAFLADRWVTTLCLLPQHLPARPHAEEVAYVVQMTVELFHKRQRAEREAG
jgi:hypothetical protein